MGASKLLKYAATGIVAAIISTVSQAQTQKPYPLRVASTGPCVCHGPLFVGIAKGIFDKHGLSIDPI